MTERHRYPATGRSAAFHPARSSLPAGLTGYSSVYNGDSEFVSSPTRYTATTTPRGYTTTSTSAGAPAAPRTYTTTVSQEPRSSRPSTREPSRNRRSTVDATARPPIIITTMQDHRPHPSTSSHTPDAHSGSPIRDTYRSSDGKLYSQPASSIRSRSGARPYHASSASEDFSRQRGGEVVLANRDADSYRSARPHVVYPSDPRHSNAAIDYGDDGYEYTNAGELVRYDLDHGGAPSRSRRHESFDRAYTRPNINYNADQRSFNFSTTHDLGRIGRPYDRGSGPPVSTRGFDKINRAYDSAREIPPAAPVPPVPTPAAQLNAGEGAPDRREGRRSRPVSLTHEPGTRLAQPEDYYRSYEADGSYDPPRFYDDSVTARGFGIRVNPAEGSEDRHNHYWESRRDGPNRDELRRDKARKDGQKDDEGARESDLEREEWYRGYKDDRRERREGRRGDEEEGRDHSRVRDKVTDGLGIAAAAVGLSPSGKRDEKAEAGRDADPQRPGARSDPDAKERSRHDADAKLNGEAAISGSDSEDGRRTVRKHRPSSVFDPNDATDLKQLREQLTALRTSDKEKGESSEKAHAASPAREDKHPESPSGEERGRELVVRGAEEKQVRVVSPPREKKEDKPLKGILKQPSAAFPEDLNPVREGVAPHKEDKKLKEVPSGARWTKINRKIVNPEALEVGKERFEVRDDFVIVLRVLSKEEIQAYAAATQVLRERRRNKENGERDRDRDHDRDYEDDRGRRPSHRHRRHRDDADVDVDDRDQDRDRDRDRERRRRHRRDEDDEYESRSRDLDHYHHRSHREV